MKKVILFAAILFAGVSVVKAQITGHDASAHTPVTEGSSKKTDKTSLTVTLNPIHSILVNTTNVNLVYTTVSDYENGVKTDYIADHLNVYSTGAYSVGVKYQIISDTSEKTTTESMFNTIEIEALGKDDVAQQGAKSLKQTDQTIISSTKGGINMMFKVDYRGKGSDAYLNFIDKGLVRTYVADVVYTLTAL